MFGLLLKDFYCLKSYMKTASIMLIFFAFIGSGMEDPTTYLSGFFTIWFLMLAITTFSYDDTAKWNPYACSLPITKKQIVLGKYFNLLLLCSMGSISALILGGIIAKVKSLPFIFITQLQISLVILGVALVFGSMLFPVIFKLGVEKARFYLIAIMALPVIALTILAQTESIPSIELLPSLQKMLPVLMTIVVISIIIVSYLISVSIYKNKDL